MKPKVTVETAGFVSAITQFAAAAGRDIVGETKNQARLLVGDLISLTPPAGGGTTGSAAKKRGEAAITGDLFGGREVDMGGFKVKTEGLFIVSNVNPADAAGGYLAVFQSQNLKPTFRKKEAGEDEIVSMFTTKTGRVYGVEKALFRPNASVDEMLAHISRYRSKATGRITRAGLRDKVIGRHVFIDKMLIAPGAKRRLLAHVHSHVGLLANGWMAAARALKTTKIPAWVRRHNGGHGDVRITPGPRGIEIEFGNTPGYDAGSGARALQRRVQSAVDMRADKMLRQIPHLLAANARKHKF